MPARTWAEMLESITAALIRDTGHDVAWWNDRMTAQPGIADERALRTWLTGEGVTGWRCRPWQTWTTKRSTCCAGPIRRAPEPRGCAHWLVT
jgi:hypothetical protein